MSITLGPWTFDHTFYDADADVAYLSIGAPRRAYGEETPEGHVALYDEETGEFCGLTIIGLRDLVEPGTCISLPAPPRDVPVSTNELQRLVPA